MATRPRNSMTTNKIDKVVVVMAMSVQYICIFVFVNIFIKYIGMRFHKGLSLSSDISGVRYDHQFMLRGRKEWRRLKVIFHLKLIVPKSKARLRESLKNVPIKIIFVKLQFSNTWVFHRTVGFNNIFFNFFWVCVFGILILSLSGHQHFHWHDKPVQYTIL
jgi:hypothetical protein